MGEDTINYKKLYIDDDMVVELGGVKNLKNIEAINLSGNSMEPILKDKSIIFIDKSKKKLVNNEIFVVNTSFGVLVRRVQLNNNNFVDLISEKSEYTKKNVPLKEITVIGKVVGVNEKC